MCVIKSKEWGKLANGLFVLFIESHENWRDSLLLLSRTPHTIHTSTKKSHRKFALSQPQHIRLLFAFYTFTLFAAAAVIWSRTTMYHFALHYSCLFSKNKRAQKTSKSLHYFLSLEFVITLYKTEELPLHILYTLQINFSELL